MNYNLKLHNIMKFSLVFIILVSIIALSVFDVAAEQNKENPEYSTLNGDQYRGRLRIFVVEKISSWKMYNDEPYHYSVADILENNVLSIDYQETYEQSYTWSGNIDLSNLMIIAAVYNSESELQYSYRDHRNQFNAFHVDATVGASPGETDSNVRENGYTHTVLIEEGTASWCRYCPDMAETLKNVYESDEVPFYYLALVEDKNTYAENRLTDDFNICAYPSSYIDGGKEVLTGSGHSETVFKNYIDSCARSDVHELDMDLTVNAESSNQISVLISITNDEPLNRPSKPSMPLGSMRPDKNEVCEYTTSSTDPNGEVLYYKWDWGDGTYSEWIGPFNSGDEAKAEYSWDEIGEHYIRVKAKNENGVESRWSYPLIIECEDDSGGGSIFEWFIELIQTILDMLFG